MDPIDRLRRLQATLGVSLGIAGEEILSASVQQLRPGSWLGVVAALAVVGLCVLGVRLLLDASFGVSRRLRRWILGRYCVEGTWFDVMHRVDEPVSIGISRIEYDGRDLRFRGFDVDLASRRSQPYTSQLAQIEWPHLHYTYDQQRPDRQAASVQGYGRLRFDTTEGRPRSYTGDYFETGGGGKVSFEGFLLEPRNDSHRRLLEALSGNGNPGAKKAALEEFFRHECRTWAERWRRPAEPPDAASRPQTPRLG